MAEQTDKQYLSFGIDGETYAVPVGKVREVLEYVKPTKLPKTAEYLKGIINVRGSGIPVVDLRTRFGLPEIPVTKDTAIIVMEIADGEGRSLVIGALTDAVHEVVDIDEGHMEPAPRFGTRIDSGLIHAIGKRGESFVIVLDIDKAFRGDETEELARAAGAAS
ncbi:MAG TPA: chemotaxis protein CheW [Spirochaetia bacterium]|nr:chemotaxis protein CheW [Spirochaetia bacterium]